MTPSFAVHPTSDYERLSTKLHKGNRDFEATERSAVAILSADPYNRSRSHKIKKLEDVPRGDGQYRLSVGGWRFRYDILAQVGGSRLLRSSPGRHVLTNRQLAARMLHIRSRLRLNRLLDPQNDVIPLTHGNAANISFKSASRSAEAISEGSGSTGTFAGAHSTTRAEWQGSLLQLAARTRAQVKTEASVLRRAREPSSAGRRLPAQRVRHRHGTLAADGRADSLRNFRCAQPRRPRGASPKGQRTQSGERQRLTHACRNATIGSTPIARRAGM
jgi:hypothetical protein